MRWTEHVAKKKKSVIHLISSIRSNTESFFQNKFLRVMKLEECWSYRQTA